MKTSFFLAAFCILSLSILLLWTKFDRQNNGDISIAVSEDDDKYGYVASFDESVTGKVQRYINHSIEPNGIFKSPGDYFNVTTTLADKTTFYIKESPGKLKIELDKKTNTHEAYLRIKRMCEGISDVLKGK